MVTNYAPNKQIYSVEMGNGHCRRPSEWRRKTTTVGMNVYVSRA